MINTFDDFLSGRISIRCDTKDEYDRLMQECEAMGLRWNSGDRPTARGYDRFESGYTYTLGNTKGLLMKCTELNRPAGCRSCIGEGCAHRNAVPFAAIFRPEPQPYDGRGKHEAGDKLVLVRDVTTYRGNTWHAGDVVTLVREDMSDNALFRHDKTGEKHYQYWCDTKPYTTPPSFKIIITTDGRVTTAKLIEGSRTIKTATATRSPEDGFDFATGARLAFARLMPGERGEIRVRVDVDTSALDAALQSVRDALKDLPNHTKAVKV